MDDHGIGGQLIRPTKMVIVHTMQAMDDLNKTVLKERSSLIDMNTCSHSSRSRYKTLINLQTVGKGSSSLTPYKGVTRQD